MRISCHTFVHYIVLLEKWMSEMNVIIYPWCNTTEIMFWLFCLQIQRKLDYESDIKRKVSITWKSMSATISHKTTLNKPKCIPIFLFCEQQNRTFGWLFFIFSVHGVHFCWNSKMSAYSQLFFFTIFLNALLVLVTLPFIFILVWKQSARAAKSPWCRAGCKRQNLTVVTDSTVKDYTSWKTSCWVTRLFKNWKWRPCKEQKNIGRFTKGFKHMHVKR